ncbi:cubilin-like [Penaeus japonicus]|uniref:cubilin-like n=1 Tax=Penaeus japonicus TaxID=27405 RepID=UPI001C714E60|nr:cubilin-like [Penaeus japonicus]
MTSAGMVCLLLACFCLTSVAAGADLEASAAAAAGELSMRDSDFGMRDAFIPESRRYIGHCDTKNIFMNAGYSRYVWSYGYTNLQQPYLADCYMKHVYNTKVFTDPFCKFGFKVTGEFESHPLPYTTCYDTDYLLFNDTYGNVAMYCGYFSEISWATADDQFELIFSTKADSPRGRGWKIKIESFKLCGGAIYTADGPTGVLETPVQSGVYPPNFLCTWYFQTTERTSVKIGCDTFSLTDPITYPNGTSYCLDFISFTSESLYATETVQYCSDSLHNNNHVVYGASSSLLVQFRSDDTDQDTGFVCNYELIQHAN